MSKCREEFERHYKYIPSPFDKEWIAFHYAWNARGKVDAEICRENNADLDECLWCDCAEAIEQENEK